MIILTIRTDKPDAEIGLFNDRKRLSYETWTAHKQLAETIHTHILMLLTNAGYTWKDLSGIVVYSGPGSFTGLRIGLSVANALALGLEIPIVGVNGDNWVNQGLKDLLDGQNHKIALPDYGAPAHITTPRK